RRGNPDPPCSAPRRASAPSSGSIHRPHALAPPTRARITERRAAGLNDQSATPKKGAECPPTFGPVATPSCAWPALFRFPACAPSRLPLRVHGDRTQEACQPLRHGVVAFGSLECRLLLCGAAHGFLLPAPQILPRVDRQPHDRLLPSLRRHRHR